MARVIAFEDAKARLMGRRIVRELCLTDDERRAALAEFEAIIDSNAALRSQLVATNPSPVVRALARHFSRETEEARA